MKIIPAIDIIEGACVRLHQGDYDQKTIYSTTPTEVMRDMIKLGADHIHIVNLMGAIEGSKLNLEPLIKIKNEYPISLQYGGGIRTYKEAKALIELGIDELILSSILFNNQEAYHRIKEDFPDHVILALDVMDESIMIKGWTVDTGINLFDYLNSAEATGVNKVLVTDISRDGTMEGFNRPLYEKLIKNTTKQVIVSGGVRHMQDVYSAKSIGAYGCIVGKSYYLGAIERLGDL